MKKLILIPLGFTLGFSLPYMAGAFFAWDFSPGDWEPKWRYIVGVLGVLSGCAGAITAGGKA